jgi:inorganic pyrophosphatase
MGLLFRAHPWHGVAIGDNAPDVVTSYIEIVPTDTVKYELDKWSGILKIDRPQRFSNVCPAPYGLVPQTFCGEAVAELFAKRSGRHEIGGDNDPLDICVITEKVISHSDILLQAVPIGGLSMLDGEEADDKILAVMKDDIVYGGCRDIDDVPKPVIDRLRHYFLTYKQAPGATAGKTSITEVYGREEAHAVIRASHHDYMARFSNIEGMLTAALRG